MKKERYVSREQIVRLRKRWHLTAGEMARLMGVSRGTIYAWSAGINGTGKMASHVMATWLAIAPNPYTIGQLKGFAALSDRAAVASLLYFVDFYGHFLDPGCDISATGD